jgi:hypothetical protein
VRSIVIPDGPLFDLVKVVDPHANISLLLGQNMGIKSASQNSDLVVDIIPRLIQNNKFSEVGVCRPLLLAVLMKRLKTGFGGGV